MLGGIGNFNMESMTPTMGMSSMKADAAFAGGIAKAESMQNKKGGDKIKPHIPKLKEERQNTGTQMGEATGSTAGAQDIFTSNPYAKDAQTGGTALTGAGAKAVSSPLDPKGKARLGQGEDMMPVDATYASPYNNAGMAAGDANYGDIKSLDTLYGKRDQLDGEDGRIGDARKQAFKDGREQMQNNQKFENNVKKHDNLAKNFGKQEQDFAKKEQDLTKASESLNKVGEALDKVSQMLQQVAQGLNTTADAVQGIPYVGPPLAAALRAVAQMMEQIAQMLQQIAQVMKQIAQMLQQMAQQMGQKKEEAGMKKELNENLSQLNQDNLDKGLQRMEQIQDAMKDLGKAAQDNNNHLNAVDKRIKEMDGEKKGAGGGGTGQEHQMAGMGPQHGMQQPMGQGQMAKQAQGQQASQEIQRDQRKSQPPEIAEGFRPDTVTAAGGGAGAGNDGGGGDDGNQGWDGHQSLAEAIGGDTGTKGGAGGGMAGDGTPGQTGGVTAPAGGIAAEPGAAPAIEPSQTGQTMAAGTQEKAAAEPGTAPAIEPSQTGQTMAAGTQEKATAGTSDVSPKPAEQMDKARTVETPGASHETISVAKPEQKGIVEEKSAHGAGEKISGEKTGVKDEEFRAHEKHLKIEDRHTDDRKIDDKQIDDKKTDDKKIDDKKTDDKKTDDKKIDDKKTDDKKIDDKKIDDKKTDDKKIDDKKTDEDKKTDDKKSDDKKKSEEDKKAQEKKKAEEEKKKKEAQKKQQAMKGQQKPKDKKEDEGMEGPGQAKKGDEDGAGGFKEMKEKMLELANHINSNKNNHDQEEQQRVKENKKSLEGMYEGVKDRYDLAEAEEPIKRALDNNYEQFQSKAGADGSGEDEQGLEQDMNDRDLQGKNKFGQQMPKQQQPLKGTDKKQKADDKKQPEQHKEQKEPVKSEASGSRHNTREPSVTTTPVRDTGPTMSVSNTRGH